MGKKFVNGPHNIESQQDRRYWRFTRRMGWQPLFLTLILASCTREHSFRVGDVTKTNQFVLSSRFGEFVSGISLHVAGKLDGSALLILSGQTTQAVSGIVDWKSYEHLRASNCVLYYIPQGVTAGRLRVDYVFH